MNSNCHPRLRCRASLDRRAPRAATTRGIIRSPRRQCHRHRRWRGLFWQPSTGPPRRHVARSTLEADALCQPRQRAAQQGVAFDVDLLAASQTPLKILGKNTGSTKPPDQLPTQLRTQLGAALISQNGVCNIAKTPSDAEPTISVGQRLRAVRQLVAGIILPPRYPAANRPLFRARIPLFQAGAAVLSSGI